MLSTRHRHWVVGATAAPPECIRSSCSAVAQRTPTLTAQAMGVRNALVAQSDFDATVTEWPTVNSASVPSMRLFTRRVARAGSTA